MIYHDIDHLLKNVKSDVSVTESHGEDTQATMDTRLGEIGCLESGVVQKKSMGTIYGTFSTDVGSRIYQITILIHHAISHILRYRT